MNWKNLVEIRNSIEVNSKSNKKKKDLFHVTILVFNCLFLGFVFHYYAFRFSKQTKTKSNLILTRCSSLCCLSACMFLQETCFDVFSNKQTNKQKNPTNRRKIKEDGIISLCVLMLSNYLSTFSFFFSLWVHAVFFLSFFFFMLLSVSLFIY